jgi:LDH2 family malate/lactate/ureidoglycolate dehydrogenase
MASSDSFTRVHPKRLEALVTALYARAGVPDDDAARLADALVFADLRGVHSHGCRWVSSYLAGLRDGRINPRPDVRAVRDEGATVTLDTDGGLGHVVVYRGMGIAIQRAKRFGTATVICRGSGHCGAMSYFTQAAADSGCIGYATTTGGLVMVPHGGREKTAGLNPLSWAAPTARGWALNLDVTTSVVAGSKLLLAKERGESIPLGWAIDPDGNPTTDPALGFVGGLLPLGGHKGYGLSVMIDVVSSLLGGGELTNGFRGTGSAQYLQVTDVAHFLPLGEFTARVDALIERLKGTAPAPGFSEVMLPGEIEHRLSSERREMGIPLDEYTRGELRREAGEAGLAYEIELA